MKPTLRIAMIAAGFAVAAWPALRAADEPAPAQPPPPPLPAAGGGTSLDEHPHRGRGEPGEELARLKEALGLTQEQSDQIEAIIKGNAPQRQVIMSDDSLSHEAKRMKMRELRDITHSRIRALLTPEQQKKFDAMPRGPEGRKGGHRWGGQTQETPPSPPSPPSPPPAPDAPPPPAGDSR